MVIITIKKIVKNMIQKRENHENEEKCMKGLEKLKEKIKEMEK